MSAHLARGRTGTHGRQGTGLQGTGRKGTFGRKSGRRLFAVAAGLAMLATGVLMPVTTAQATSLARVDGGKNVIMPSDKVTTLGVPTTQSAPVEGAHGPTFQPAPTPGEIGPRVVGGPIANSADFPGVVGVQSTYWNEQQQGWYIVTCTGTVLTSTKVLTAGHCVTDLPWGTTWVVAGRNNLNSGTGGFVARVSSTWTHQNFNFTSLATQPPIDDVSVLTLKDSLPPAYTPVTLTGQDDQTPYVDGTSATIVGYGVTATGAQDSGVLHQATVPIKSDATCAATYLEYDPDRMTCAGDPGSGIDTCSGDSGGPIFVAGVQAGITDWGQNPCGSSYGVYERLSYYADAIAEDLTRPALVNLDWTGDGHSDLFARTPGGNLMQWTGTGFANDGRGGFAGESLDGTGWQGYTKLFRVTNWNADGRPSIMAKDSAGRLFQYKGDGEGFFASGAIQVGTGWNIFTDIMVVNNWNGDGQPNLMGRTSNGDLYIYTSDGAGGWQNGGIGIQIGTGWNMFNTVLTPGPWNGDGMQSLIGRTASGTLLLYTSDGAGGWQNSGVGVQIGTGWNTFSIFMSPGDWNGDNMIDLIGVQPNGFMRLYKTDGHGVWLEGGAGQQIGTGWNSFNAVF